MKDNEVLIAVIGVAAGVYILDHFIKSSNVAYSYQATTTDEFCEVCKKSHNGFLCGNCLDITQGGGGDVYPSTTYTPQPSYIPNDIDYLRQKERETQRKEEEKTKRLEQLLKEQQQHPQHPTTPQHSTTPSTHTPPAAHPSAPVHTTTPQTHPTKLLGYGEGPMDIETTGLYGFYDLDSGFGGSGGGSGGGIGGDYGGSGGEMMEIGYASTEPNSPRKKKTPTEAYPDKDPKLVKIAGHYCTKRDVQTANGVTYCSRPIGNHGDINFPHDMPNPNLEIYPSSAPTNETQALQDPTLKRPHKLPPIGSSPSVGSLDPQSRYLTPGQQLYI